MSKLNKNSIINHSKAELAHEENFELTVNIKAGNSESAHNFATARSHLESRLSFSQHGDTSNIESFDISKVIRDENNEIVKSTLILSSNESE